MELGRWQDCEGTWDRLAWARTRWQKEAGAVGADATNAAESLGIKPGTYRAYERAPGSSKHTALDHQKAIQFGRKFRVNWQWLLTGQGTPFDDVLGAEQERVVQAMSQLDPERQRIIVEMVEGMLKTGTR